MKHIKTFVTMAIVALVALTTFTSCDRDVDISNDLDGIWRGNMYIEHCDRYGTWYKATSTEVEFLVYDSFSNSGTGHWVDYYSGAPWDYIYNDIRWSVNNGTIRVYFVQEGTTIFISHYSLGSRFFEGTIDDNGNYVDFSLTRISTPRYGSWSYYEPWGYGYYAKGSRTADNDSVQTEMPKRRIAVPE